MTVHPLLRIAVSCIVLAGTLAVSGCASASRSAKPAAIQDAPSKPGKADAASARRTALGSGETELKPGIPDPHSEPVWGRRFYLDDGPGDMPAAELDQVPDAVPTNEPLNPFTSQPYSIFGRTYTPLQRNDGFSEKGLASWYGKRFHGKRTSSGEPYNMYAMSAAHPTLPIPSYARVTNVTNGRSVVVRINDRGPFHPGRIMDLSYAAAHRLGFSSNGSAEVAVEALQPGSTPAPEAGTAQARAEPIATKQVDLASRVRVERSPRGKPAPAGDELWLQLGAFGSRENAEALKQSVGRKLPELVPGLTVLELDGKWRLRVGPLYNREAMDYARGALKEKMGISAFAVKP